MSVSIRELFHPFRVAGVIDSLIRFFIYLMIFWLPYSSAMIEVSVIAGGVLWLIKKVVLAVRGPSVETFEGEKPAVWTGVRVPDNPLSKPLGYFLLVCCFSAAASVLPAVAFRGVFSKTLEWVIIYLLVIETFRTPKHLKTALAVYLFTSTAICLDALYQFHISHKDVFFGRAMFRDGATAAFKHKNSLGVYLTLLVPLTMAGAFTKGMKLGKKVLWVFLAVLSCWAMVLTFSRGAWFGLMAGIFFLVVYLKGQKMLIPFLIGALLIGGAAITLKPSLIARARMSSGHLEETFGWRGSLWLDTGKMIKARPVLGHGVNTYMRLFQNYRRKSSAVYDFDPTYAHNCYVQMAAETGFMGLGCFFWAMVGFFRNTRAGKGVSKKNRGYLPEALCWGLAAGVTAYLCHAFFDIHFYSLQLGAYFWLMLGFSVQAFNLLQQGLFCDKNEAY